MAARLTDTTGENLGTSIPGRETSLSRDTIDLEFNSAGCSKARELITSGPLTPEKPYRCAEWWHEHRPTGTIPTIPVDFCPTTIRLVQATIKSPPDGL
jgi:hypothetical protein